jgi:UDP-N-acetylmuramyl pentapeptide phosphotransferase/UDP-N-acetylglucosamine-1-phosphate transferase
MAVIGFLALGILGYMSQHDSYALLNIVIAASAAGFLVLNYPPAKLFMGDSGSTVLGLLAASMVLWGARDGVMEIYTGLLVFSPFIVDATVTLTRRLFRGERVWEAHREHSYQKLVLLGYGHRRTVQLEYVLMIACTVSSLIAVQSAEKVKLGIYGFWIILYITLIVLIDFSWKKANGKVHGQAD